jgi:hypothetical protein
MTTATKLTTLLLMLAGFAMSAEATVTVAKPANGTEVTSPFTLSANSSTCSAQTVSAMGYSLDNSSDTTIIDSTTVNAQVQAATGSHTLHVKAWGNKGSACVTDVAISVQPITTIKTSAPVIPSNAVSVSSIQTLANWHSSIDTAVAGSASGVTGLDNSPSRSGNARKFVTKYSNYGNERYYVSFGDDTEATNFLYDAWVYVASSSSDVANVEMDMNQVMPNGQTVIFGFQCDGWAGTWDYTANIGSPKEPIDTWLHSSASCNPRSWKINAWHHVEVSYSRDTDGNVTYKSVWLDGVEQTIDATVPSAFALGWSPTLLTNFQVDGYTSATGASTIYLDELTIYRW